MQKIRGSAGEQGKQFELAFDEALQLFTFSANDRPLAQIRSAHLGGQRRT
jgi:hypothetical protein